MGRVLQFSSYQHTHNTTYSHSIFLLDLKDPELNDEDDASTMKKKRKKEKKKLSKQIRTNWMSTDVVSIYIYYINDLLYYFDV